MSDPGEISAASKDTAEKVAIVVSHGSLARGLVSAMEKVLGPQPNVFWLSNTGRTPAALETEIEALIAREAPGKEVYLLTDLRGGSCATTCLRTSKRSRARAIFYGANLTLLLEFVLLQDLAGDEFFDALLGKARSSVDGVLFHETSRDGGDPGAEESAHAGRPVGEAAAGARRPG